MGTKGKKPDCAVANRLKGHAEIGAEIPLLGTNAVMGAAAEPEGETEPPPAEDEAVKGDLGGDG